MKTIRIERKNRIQAWFIADEELQPKRATRGSSAYDFKAPERVVLPPRGFIKFDSKVRVAMPENYVLQLYIRSSLGAKGLTLTNAVGIIDSDYKGSIQAMLMNNSDTHVIIEKGERYMQGIFTQYFITENDDTTAERNGGLGSTGK